MDDFKIYKNWIQPSEFMNEDQKKEYFGMLCLHILGTPQRAEDAEDVVVKAALVNTLPLVEQAGKSREESVERGKKGGRPPKLTKEMVHDYVMENPGCTCKEVADHFGVKHSTIAHNQGWKERDKFWF